MQWDSLCCQLKAAQKAWAKGQREPRSPGVHTAFSKRQLFQSFTAAFPDQTRALPMVSHSIPPAPPALLLAWAQPPSLGSAQMGTHREGFGALRCADGHSRGARDALPSLLNCTCLHCARLNLCLNYHGGTQRLKILSAK